MTTRVEAVLEAIGVQGRRRGDRIWALCPWHEGDRSPTNFFVRLAGRRRRSEGDGEYSVAGQNFCFSCKRGGSLVDLVQRVRGGSREAAEDFVERRGVGAPRLRARVRVVERQPELGRRRFRLPPEIIFEPLAEWVGPARGYVEERKIFDAEEVELFRIGYAVDGRLAGRIVLPWWGPGWRAGGYSARTFADDEPKYLTPHEREAPERSTMFGEHLWPPRAGRGVLVVTEGALNAMAARRALRGASVAALGGSEVDDGQAIKIATFPDVIVLTDPDAAGEKAAISLRGKIGRHSNLTRVRLPPGKDALDVERKMGREELSRRLYLAMADLAS